MQIEYLFLASSSEAYLVERLKKSNGEAFFPRFSLVT